MGGIGIINAAHIVGRAQMVTVADIADRYLRLAIQNFERAERTDNPQLRVKLRGLAEDYRDRALEMLDRRWSGEG
jgi:hypothetical protein